MLTGKKANNGYTVSFSHIRNKKLQGANLQYKRVYWPEQQRRRPHQSSVYAAPLPAAPPAGIGAWRRSPLRSPHAVEHHTVGNHAGVA